MTRKLLVADLLCGAGGSSTGCARALKAMGREMELVCLNHWPVAIQTHSLNHPKARHYVQDIATVRPHIIVPEGYLDLLMASPTCTHHSVARGGKPTSDQQRSDPWHIITWFTELRVRRAIIENVWEFIKWGPVNVQTGKPVKGREGEYFRAWIDTIRKLGATGIEWRKLNAADFGDATTRSRFIMFIRFDRKKVIFPAATHARFDGGRLELFPGIKPWRPAREIIDWNLKGKSIFDRKKPLAPKTLARIYSGAVKFQWPEPFLVILRNHMAAQSVDQPIPTIAANGNHVGLAQPVLYSRKSHILPAKDLADAARVIAADIRDTMPVQPVIVNGRKGNKAKSVATDPVPTLDTKGGVWLAEPFIATVAHGNEASEKNPNNRRTKSIDDPLGSMHGDGIPYAVVEPFNLNRHGENGSVRAHDIGEPAPAADCRGAGYLVEPFVLSRQSEGAPRGVDEPIPTQTAVHSPVLISPYYGTGSGETCNSADQPLPTMTSKARFGMVVPVTHAGGLNRAQDDAEPLPVITCANRGELAFVAAQFGERDGQTPRVHDISEPASTGMTLGNGALVEGTPHYDILFRMLEPHELAAAMGFTTEDETYEFAGTKTEQVKQIGNAVSVRMMQACVTAMFSDVAPKVKPHPSFAIAAE